MVCLFTVFIAIWFSNEHRFTTKMKVFRIRIADWPTTLIWFQICHFQRMLNYPLVHCQCFTAAGLGLAGLGRRCRNRCFFRRRRCCLFRGGGPSLFSCAGFCWRHRLFGCRNRFLWRSLFSRRRSLGHRCCFFGCRRLGHWRRCDTGTTSLGIPAQTV